MEQQRVNHIAVNVGNCITDISLYRTNQKLGELTNRDLDIPAFEDCGLDNKMLYANFCRDFVIHLLNRGGIDGFYYEAKQEVTDDTPRRFDNSNLMKTATDTVTRILTEMLEGTQAKLQSCTIAQVDVQDRYKDKYIRNGKVDVICNLKYPDKYDLQLTIPVEIKSGQLCKPKEMHTPTETYKLNITNIKMLLA